MERTKLTGRVTGEPLQWNNRNLAMFSLRHDNGITTVLVDGTLAIHCQTDFKPGSLVEVYGHKNGSDFNAEQAVIRYGSIPYRNIYPPKKTA